MKIYSACALFLTSCASLFFLAAAPVRGASNASPDQARVTRIIRDVKLLPAKAEARPAALDDKVSAGTGVRTGNQSRSELTFVDQTITRLGADTVFVFHKAGRSIDLSTGALLFSVPKNSGGAQMRTSAATVGITGTTVILEATRAGGSRLTGLEGSARFSLTKYPKESAVVRGGQMLDVPPGATKLPPVVNVDLDKIMKSNPLITDFRPLPAQDLIYATQRNPPESGGPGPGFPPILGDIIGAGLGIPFGGGSGHTSHPSGHRTGGEHSKGGEGSRSGGGEHGAKPTGTKGSGTKGSDSLGRTSSPHPRATPMKKKATKPVSY